MNIVAENKPCYLYLMSIVTIGGNYHKIGISYTPEIRKRELRASKLLAVFKFNSKRIAWTVEREWHCLLFQYRNQRRQEETRQHEYYYLPKNIVKFICSLQILQESLNVR